MKIHDTQYHVDVAARLRKMAIDFGRACPSLAYPRVDDLLARHAAERKAERARHSGHDFSEY